MSAPEPEPLRPYADFVHLYLEAGWASVVPLGQRGHRNEKAPVPKGTTGYAAIEPSPEQIERWRSSHAVNNLGIVMPTGVVGIDVDDYEKGGKTKTGAEQLAKLEAELGPLPGSPISTARGVGNPSGIRFYRLPEPYLGKGLRSGLGPDLDVIRPGHRYAAAWPSRHPETGETYRWLDRTHRKVLRTVPRVDKLEELPQAWCEFLCEDSVAEHRASLDLEDGEIREWLAEHGAGVPCRATRGVLRKVLAGLEEPDVSHYDAAVEGVWALVQLAAEGHLGVRASIKPLREAYEDYTSGVVKRDPTEWARMVRGGVSKAAALVAEREAEGQSWAAHPEGKCPGVPVAPDPSLWPSPNAPLAVAERYVAQCWTDPHGAILLRRWRGDYYAWSGQHWAPVTEEALHVQLYGLLRDATFTGAAAQPTELRWNPTDAKLRAVLRALAGVSSLYRGEDRDAEKAVVLSNGVLDVATRELAPHTPARFVLAALPFGYSPRASCPAWLDFLDSIWEDGRNSGEAGLLAKIMGYVISGETNLQKMFVLIGPPRSGKGTVGRVLASLMGPDNVCAPTLARMGGTFGLQQFLGKSLAIIGDADHRAKSAMEAVEDLKAITGEDSMTVHRKNRDDWTGRLGVRFVLQTNNVPAFMDPSGALAERMVPVQFHRSFAGQEDTGLGDRLHAELTGILSWCLDGLDALLAAGGAFELPAMSAALRQSFFEDFSPIKSFLNDECVRTKVHDYALREDVYTAYVEWCHEEGRHPQPAAGFSRDLRSVLPHAMGDGKRIRVDGVQKRVYYGVKLRGGDRMHIPTTGT